MATATMEAPTAANQAIYRKALFQAVETGKRPPDDELAGILSDARRTAADFDADCGRLQRRFLVREQYEELPLLRVQVETVAECSADILARKGRLRQELRRTVAKMVRQCDAEVLEVDAEVDQFKRDEGLPDMQAKIDEYSGAEQELLDSCDPELAAEYKALESSDSAPPDYRHRKDQLQQTIDGPEVGFMLDGYGRDIQEPRKNRSFWAAYAKKMAGLPSERKYAEAKLEEIAKAEAEMARLDQEYAVLQVAKREQLVALRDRMLDWRSGKLSAFG